MIDTLNARSIHYIYLSIDDLRKAADQVLEIPSEVYVKPQQYRHLLMRPLDFQVLAASVQTNKGKEVARELVKLGFVVHCYREYELEVKEQEKQVLQDKNKALEGEKQVLKDRNEILQCENSDLYKCKAEMTKDPLKDLTLKVLLPNGGDNKFAVIRGQKTHADAYTKKYMNLWRGCKTVDFKHHPNPISKWAKLRKLLADHHKIEQLDGNIYQCINDYNLSTLMKDLKIEHKQQCVMIVSGPNMDDYLKDKPVLQQPAVADHNYCKVN